HLGIKTSPYMQYADEASAQKFLEAHGPIVVKPESSEQSKGVTVHITGMTELREAVAVARQHSKAVLLQKEFTGQSYRLLTVGGKFCAAVLRYVPLVIGDGERTIRALVDEKNGNPLRGTGSTSPLKKIKHVDVVAFLDKQGRSLGDIPALDERVE